MNTTPADPPRLNDDETHEEGASDDEVTQEERAMDIALGKVLKLLRVGQNLSQEALAADVGMNKKTIMRIESGERSIRMQQLYRLCLALGVMPSDVTQAAEGEIGIE